MALATMLFVSKRLQIVAAALLCLMMAHLVAEIVRPGASTAAVTLVRLPVSLSQTGR